MSTEPGETHMDDDVESPIEPIHVVGILWRACREGDIKLAAQIVEPLLTAMDAGFQIS